MLLGLRRVGSASSLRFVSKHIVARRERTTKAYAQQTWRDAPCLAAFCPSSKRSSKSGVVTPPSASPPLPLCYERGERAGGSKLCQKWHHGFGLSSSLSFFLWGMRGKPPTLFARLCFGVVGGTMELGGLIDTHPLPPSPCCHSSASPEFPAGTSRLEQKTKFGPWGENMRGTRIRSWCPAHEFDLPLIWPAMTSSQSHQVPPKHHTAS